MPELTMERRFALHRESMLRHGAAGGFIGGAIMMFALLIISAALGNGFWRPAELFGSIWQSTVQTGAGFIVLGVITGLVVAVLLGLLYSYVISWVRMEPVVSGLIYGAFAWAFLGVLVLNTAFNHVYQGFTIWNLFVSFLLYGLVLGLFEDWADRTWVRRSRGEGTAGEGAPGPV